MSPAAGGRRTAGPAAVAAVDLGATSGRVIVGRVSADSVRLEQVTRFPNQVVETPDGLHWSILELWREVVDGLAAAEWSAAEDGAGLASIGVDSWAVDYGLLRGDRLIGTPHHYRDPRTERTVEEVRREIPLSELYARNGLQFLPFTTLYQLRADRDAGLLADADGMLLIPDLLGHWLTGERLAEVTNASTTGLLTVGSAQEGRPRWDLDLVERLGLPAGLLPPLVEPGTEIGGLLPALRPQLRTAARVTAVGSHDTASAVVAIPMTESGSAYISCGTWGLVGVETEHPVLTDAAREANFTNEGGVDGRVRFLHNVMGLWLLTESIRGWERADQAPIELDALLGEAGAIDRGVPLFDPNDPRFLTPGDTPARIAAWCQEHGSRAPHSRAEVTRSILESLAQAFTEAVRAAGELSGTEVRRIHLVGGGSQNALLCRLIAARSGLPVLAGPVEATALGNVLVQARALGAISGDLETLRALVAREHPPIRYLP